MAMRELMALVTSPPHHNLLLASASLSLVKSRRAPPFSSAGDLFKDVQTRTQTRTIRGSTPVLELNSVNLSRGERERNSEQIQAGFEIEIEEAEDQILEEINSVTTIAVSIPPTLQKIYVAIGKDLVESAYALQWGLRYIKRNGGSVTLLHVFVPARLIPTPVGRVPAGHLIPDTVAAYRKDELEKTQNSVQKYVTMCSSAQVEAEILMVEKAEVTRGIVEAVSELRVTKLIMGTTSPGAIAKKMKMGPGKADYVRKHASNFCEIYVVCKGRLLHRRAGIENGGSSPARSRTARDGPAVVAEEAEPGLDLRHVVSPAHSENPSRSFNGRPSDCLTSRRPEISVSTKPPTQQFNLSALPKPNARSQNSDDSVQIPSILPCEGNIDDRTRQEEVEGLNHETPFRPDYCLESLATNNQNLTIIERKRKPTDPSATSSDVQQEGFQTSSLEILSEVADSLEQITHHQPLHEEHSAGLIDHYKERSMEIETLKSRLRKAMKEADDAMKVVRVEAEKRKKSESEAIKSITQVKDYEARYKEEAKQKEDARSLLRMVRQQSEEIRRQRDEDLHELETLGENLRTLELQVNETSRQRNEIVQELYAARQTLATLTLQNDCICQERDDARKQLHEWLHRETQTSSPSSQLHRDTLEFREFSFDDLKDATCNFSDHFRIGEGCCGTVYKGEIHHTTVAIKILRENSVQGRREFQHEIDLLRTVRHRHLVSIVGACTDRGCIVYEYMGNGSLEDRLLCKEGTPPLPWHARFRIAAEICSALLFLHTAKPDPIIHGDLKPANILLDHQYGSKLSDFGHTKLIPADFSHSQTISEQTEIKGSFPYTDPDCQRTGECTPRSDVYSLGIVLMQLLTGKPALGVSKDVERALESGKLEDVLDRSAGGWPPVQATQLAYLALHCAETSSKNRPDLYPTVMQTLDQLRTMAIAASPLSSTSSDSPGSGSHEEIRVPSFFLCPIFQEIMHDPRVAADGFTYECEAIKGWFDGGHDTSPMTNLKLNHKNLTPNHSLRSAIRQWQDDKSKLFSSKPTQSNH